MAKEYRVGERYYLPVRVREIMDDTYTYPVRFEFENGNGCMDGMNAIKSDPNLLLNAEEVAENLDRIARSILEEYSKNAETRIKELETERDVLKAQLQKAQESIDYNNEVEKNRTKYANEQQVTIYRKNKVIDVLTEKIVALEMMLDEEREKHNG